ncbi:cytochrome P450 81Q32-like [Salvia hispanica]|uniref:cytochrome P450 81Q32-like n=1 Tax=Salvia hispanica TaxID=49212 RepID=UPI0020096E41|nr:cytochrome P450 81Q32-like [Salvia hispanica]XP_047950400.1 cytochrome P450 81Q32-like [Salvia hispanica]
METSWISILLLLFIAIKYLTKQKGKIPPSPNLTLPLVGHLHLLKFPLHRTYHNLSLKLGPIFSLRFGNRLIVVVSSPATVEDCFTKNDIVLANRPRFISAKYVGYNYTSVTFAPYGDYWRNLRRLTTVEIFSTARLNAFQSIRADEVQFMLKSLVRQGSSIVEIRPLLSALTFNNIMRMVAGKWYFGVEGVEDDEEAREFREVLKEVFKYGGVANPGDFLPLLRWIDYMDVEKNLSRIMTKLDAFLQRLIEEHKSNNGGNTMVDHMLSLQESEPQNYTHSVIKSTMLVMLLAGTDTSSITIEWAMSALLNHPDKMKKAREEIDRVIGSDRLLNESDLPKLPYLQNIINETFRLYPAAPLLLPHEAAADCKIAGYDIPRGTIVQVNAWAIHRDPRVWDEPERFRPERFEAAEPRAPQLLPFGMGRRSCPGNVLALRMVGLTLGCLVQCFYWERVEEGLIDMREAKVGVTISKQVPLEAKCRARPLLGRVLAL